ncbi:MAG: cell division protein ZapE [Hyphomicrobium sp.]|nr:cell division protein ZapE [Hyphomicrobium sp.]
MTRSVLEAYRAHVATGDFDADAAQLQVAARLDALARELEAWRPGRASARGLFGFGRPRAASVPRGLYIHGAVGRGKTMLMDLFHETVQFAPRRRVHFHAFMAEVHERIARGRATTEGDPIPFVAAEIAGEAPLLCFDEFHVTDIADAMILGRLFKGLFERDVVVVATSNAHPERLYWNGLNRQLFLPFVVLLLEKLDVVELESGRDFRLAKLSGRPLYFAPADAAARKALDGHWLRLTGQAHGAPASIDLLGRRLEIPEAAMGVARASFEALCAKPLSSADYLALSRDFHTVILDDIPVITPDRRNEARRFISLIDTLYDRGVCLIASAEAEPDALYPAGDGADLFERTASRLMEMRSEAYLSGLRREAASR